jgi:hypothetical protein
MSKSKKKIELFSGAESTAALNESAYEDYVDLLLNMAMSIYRIDGLPPEVDQRYLKMTWLKNGLVVGFYDEDYGKHMFLMASPSGQMNMQYQPTSYTVTGAGGYNRTVIPFNVLDPMSKEEMRNGTCVPIWFNYTHTSPYRTILRYARVLADIDRTIDVNLIAQKTPIIIMCEDERQRLSVENFISGYVGNRPVVVTKSPAMPDSLSYVTSGAPYLVDQLLVSQSKIWNKAMTFIGINNANMEKKEREISAEVESNNDQVGASRLIQINNLRTGFNEYNRLYGTDIQVYFNSDTASALLEGQELMPLAGVNVDIGD